MTITSLTFDLKKNGNKCTESLVMKFQYLMKWDIFISEPFTFCHHSLEMKHSSLDVYFLSGGLGILNRCRNLSQSPGLMSLTSDLRVPELWSIATHANRETQPYITHANMATDMQSQKVQERCWNVFKDAFYTFLGCCLISPTVALWFIVGQWYLAV